MSMEWASNNSNLGRTVQIGCALVVCLMVAQCGTTETAKRADGIVDLPDQYSKAPVEAKPLNQWCSDFDAPSLDRMVDKAFDDNLNLRSAWARLEQARARAKKAFGGRLPGLNLSGSGSKRHMIIDIPRMGSQSIETDQRQVSLGASYEVDLWGKMANRHQAAKFSARAARADTESMAISMMSGIANQWFEVVYRRQQIELLEAQVETSREFLKLTKKRYRKGMSSLLDINQQRQQIQAQEGKLIQARGQLELAVDQLAVLLGETPNSELELPAESLPELPDTPAPGVPADLLKRRPDIRAAKLRLKAADQQVAAAIKERFPSVTLSASLFYQAESITGLFQDLLRSAAVEIGMPLFRGGAISAEIDRTRAVVEQRLYEYGQTLLEALKDVRDALTMEKRQAQFVQKLVDQRDTARHNLELARSRYQNGAVSYLRVLDALQALHQVEQQLLDAKRRQFGNRVQLCRAIGGTWTQDLESPLTEDKNK